jgi:hypothetical protein
MSLLRAIKAQLGLSVTPANNFTLDASADNGSMKLARGNAGVTTQDIITVDPAGKVAFPQNIQPVLAAQAIANQDIPDNGTQQQIVFGQVNKNVGFGVSGNVFTPQVAGYYLVTLSFTATVAASSMFGLYAGIVSSTGQLWNADIMEQTTPLITSLATSVSGVVYCNGTTDSIQGQARISGTNPTISATARISAVLVRAA